MSTKKNDISKNISGEVHQARKSKKVTLKQLAEKTGISVGHLSDFENGKTMLGGEKLISVCRTLGLPLVSEDQPPAYAVTQIHQGLNSDENALIEIYRRLDDQHRLNLMEIAVCYQGFCGGSPPEGQPDNGLQVYGSDMKLSGGAGG